MRDGGKPLLGLYDIEKAFDSVEIPILLEQVYSNWCWKLWRPVKHWYSTTTARVRMESYISDTFPISRGVQQASILYPTLFLVVRDKLICLLCQSIYGLSVRATYGCSYSCWWSQNPSFLNKMKLLIFSRNFLKLNSEKFEIVKISLHSEENNSTLSVWNRDVSTSQSARCLGVWWNSRQLWTSQSLDKSCIWTG